MCSIAHLCCASYSRLSLSLSYVVDSAQPLHHWSLMTQQISFLAMIFPDVSGVYEIVSDQALDDVQQVSISGVIPIAHRAFVVTLNLCRTSWTTVLWTSSMVVYWSFTPLLMLPKSGCAAGVILRKILNCTCGPMASAEREPITGVWGRSPQRGFRGQSPRWRVRGAKPPWSWNLFSA